MIAPLKKILVVDDNKNDSAGIANILKAIGYRDLLCAVTGEEALEKAMRVKPDLVILDVLLPDDDGFHVCERMKAMNGASPKVILITGHMDETCQARARLVGADDFVVKTNDNSEMILAIRKIFVPLR